MITREQFEALRPGDDITFRAVTRSGARKVTRKVIERLPARSGSNPYYTDIVTVQYHGWRGFVVSLREITAINGEEVI